MSEIIKALAAALPKVEGAGKSGMNPHFKKKYSDISDVITAIRPVLEDGIWYRQANVERDMGAAVETFYIHTSGEELSAGVTYVPANKKDAQGFGSAITYVRRYSLQTAFGIAPEDDDGNASVKASTVEKEPLLDNVTDLLAQVKEATSADELKNLWNNQGKSFAGTEHESIINDAFNKKKKEA